MRLFIALSVLAVGLAGSVHVRPSAAADAVPMLAVGVDRVVTIRLWGPASTVVVGNPAIADVNLVNGRTLLITGHAVGQTSIMVLDSSGRETFHQTVLVGPADAGHVSVQRGRRRRTIAARLAVSGLWRPEGRLLLRPPLIPRLKA